MRERGRYQIQCMKTRSSSGVGQKVELEFDIESLRIRDLGEEAEAPGGFVKKPSIYESIKSKSTLTSGVPDDEGSPKITAEVQSNKLKQLLGQIKQS